VITEADVDLVDAEDWDWYADPGGWCDELALCGCAGLLRDCAHFGQVA
jgi:hypothetical protein